MTETAEEKSTDQGVMENSKFEDILGKWLKKPIPGRENHDGKEEERPKDSPVEDKEQEDEDDEEQGDPWESARRPGEKSHLDPNEVEDEDDDDQGHGG